MPRNVAIRLGTEGKAQVRADLDEIANSGDAVAKRWSRSFERAGDDVQAAMQRQANAAAKLAMIMPQSSMQMRINDANGTGFGQWEGSARQSAAAFRELYAEQERLEAGARALRAAIDPAVAAQDRFNAEMAEARTLIAAGKISLDEYVAKLRIERAALNESAEGHRRNGTAMAALAPQFQDILTQASMGANIFPVLAIQIGQAASQMIYMEGAAGKFASVMMSPVGLAIQGGLVLLGMLTSSLFASGDASDDLSKRQASLANELDRTTGKVKEQVTWLSILAGARDAEAKAAAARDGYQAARRSLQVNGQNAGQTFVPDENGGHWVDGVSARGRAIIDRELARYNGGYGGGINAETLVRNLQAAAKNDPSMKEAVGTIEQLAFKVNDASNKSKDLQVTLARTAVAVGTATEAQRRLVAATTEGTANDKAMIEAKAKLAGATTAMDRAQAQYTLSIREADQAYERSNKTDADKAKLLAARTSAEHALNVAQDANRKGGDRHAQSMGRQAAAMEVSASAALDLAKAYLAGGDAAIRAEAARKGLTDATRKGIDGDAQTQRQLDIMIGDQLANGAKSVAQLRDETAARRSVNAQLLAGTMSVDQMSRALSDEAALRPLLKLQTLAQGDALKVLTDVIEQYKAALAEAHEEEAKGAAFQSIEATKQRVAEIKASILDLSKSPEQQAIAAARRAANAEADGGKFSDDDRKLLVEQRILEAVATSRANQAKYIIDAMRGQQDSIALAQRELQLAGANDNYRSVELEKLSKILEIRRDFPNMAQADIDAQLRGIEVLAGLHHQIDLAKASMEELRGFGVDFVDTVLSEDTWSSWGNAGKTILKMIQDEFIKLALLNPLKNLINGNDALPTVTSLFSSVSKLFGGGNSGLNLVHEIGHNAAGTEYWSGGMSLVGENGPEIVSMPRGSAVTPAGETRRLLSAGQQPVKVLVQVAANDYFDAKVASISGAQLEAAAPHIATGAATLAGVQQARRARRRLVGG